MKVFSIVIDKSLKAGEIISVLIGDLLNIEGCKVLNSKPLSEFLVMIDRQTELKRLSVFMTDKSMLIVMEYPLRIKKRFAKENLKKD